MFVSNIGSLVDGPPDVSILLPRNDAHYPSSMQIEFKGEANSKRDGDLTSKLAWLCRPAQGDGETDPYPLIGTGGTFYSQLPKGRYIVTAVVKDSKNRKGSTSIEIAVASE